jgi:hypothetical protein
MKIREAAFHKVLEGKVSQLGVSLLADEALDLAHPYVLKLDGSLADDPAQYIHDTYGAAVAWDRAEEDPDAEYIFRLTGFREWEGGSASMWCYCLDTEMQEPLAGKAAIRWWPDAPPVQILPPASVWDGHGIVARIKETGAADWGVGRGEAYFIQTGSGPCKVWIASLDGPSDRMRGWGWLDGTHYQQLCPVFERILVKDDPGPGPENGDLADVVAQLKRIADKMEAGWTLE